MKKHKNAGPDRAKKSKRGMRLAPSRAPRGNGLRAVLGAELFFNRELSWLDFNARVLAQAASPATPLLERVKFLAIFSTNLDEFFMVRVAGLKEQLRTRTREGSPAGLTPDEQLEAISKRVRDLVQQQSRLWQKELQPLLHEEKIEVVPRGELSQEDRKFLKQYFLTQVFPVLTPLGIDPAHPFPHLPNKSVCLCVHLRTEGKTLLRVSGGNGQDGEPRSLYALVEVPRILPRFVPLKAPRGRSRFVLLRDVIGLFLPLLFAGAEVVDSYVIRITRDSDLDLDEEEAEDLLKVIEAELRQRQWGNVVRLEVSSRAPDHVMEFLRESLQIEKRDIYPIEGPLNFGDFLALAHLDGYDRLRYPVFSPHLRAMWREADSQLFDLIRSRDLLAHHPYETFATVMDFIEAAAVDRDVLAIKMTLYRTSPESPIMRSLIRAANNGKQVVVLVELKARFDEANNIHWARRLEREGVHVVYGIVGLKTHCKMCLVVRREERTLRRYLHVSTGNYNPNTANLYTDLSLFSSDPVLCEDVANLFNMLTGFASHSEWRAIVPSPDLMQRRLLELIEAETAVARRGGQGRIICKMNSLVDPVLTAALYEASQAGVQTDLIVRGICCLRPGVPGVSENIRVTSLVGRFLEHTRIFCFGQDGDPAVYISSADWMQRNFYSRIEVMVPVRDAGLRMRVVDEILTNCLADTANAWELGPDGTWSHKPVPPGLPPFDSQAHFVRIEESQSVVATVS